MADVWQPIRLSAKVFGHLSQGLYRTPAGAIKELISNSFDADARLVRIHTDFPRFETFSCEDDGTGMSRNEFQRLMNRGIGSSYKRTTLQAVSDELHRPLIGRLGLGILSLAQVCTQFDLVSHHKESKSGFRAVIKFPPYTRAEMDKITKSAQGDDEIHGGEFQIFEEKYNSTKKGLRVFTKYLRESFRKRMRETSRLANKRVFRATQPYRTFEHFLDAIYSPPKTIQSLNLTSDYDQLLFGLALAAPLPFLEECNIAVQIPMIYERQTQIKSYNFQVKVDNMSLASPVFIPSDRAGHTAKQCLLISHEKKKFTLHDGPTQEECEIVQHSVTVENSDEKFQLCELRYSNKSVAGSPLKFNGYLFQQTGRLYPRDIQGVLIRLSNVAIGKYDNSMLAYPYAEGPRYSMISSELFVENGFEDALNIDRDSFNELHPHYVRTQSYVHSLLHELIFPETWGEEKRRNKARRTRAALDSTDRFIKGYSKTTGDAVRTIHRIEKTPKAQEVKTIRASPVEFKPQKREIEIDQNHPLLQPILRRRKYADLIEKLAVAFERSNSEASTSRRREVFYKLLAEIFNNL